MIKSLITAVVVEYSSILFCPQSVILPQRTVLHLTPVLRLDTTCHVSYNVTLCSIKIQWKCVKEVNNSIWHHSTVLWPNVSRQSMPDVNEWIYQYTRNEEITFLCWIYNVLAYKFDLDVSSRTDGNHVDTTDPHLAHIFINTQSSIFLRVPFYHDFPWYDSSNASTVKTWQESLYLTLGWIPRSWIK